MITKIPIEIVELEQDSFHIFIQIIIGSDNIANMVIDTGASKTVFDENFIKNNVINIEKNDDIYSSGINSPLTDTKIAIIDKIKIGNLIIEKFSTVIINLDYINNIYKKIKKEKISGFIGGDFLNKYCAKIDYGSKLLTLIYDD
ncbi:MAG: aspartyl protease family protein [Bacteroidales bacterium]|nr:aspartyl protease family protein [Bacteroidales bacterium]